MPDRWTTPRMDDIRWSRGSQCRPGKHLLSYCMIGFYVRQPPRDPSLFKLIFIKPECKFTNSIPLSRQRVHPQ